MTKAKEKTDKKTKNDANEIFGVTRKQWTALCDRFEGAKEGTDNLAELAKRLELKGDVAALGYMFGRTVEENEMKFKMRDAMEQMFKKMSQQMSKQMQQGECGDCDCEDCSGGEGTLPTPKAEQVTPRQEARPSYFG